MADTRSAASGLWGSTVRSVGFLSRIPMPPGYFSDTTRPSEMRNDTRAFALAGLLIGVFPAAALLVLSAIGMPDLLAAALTILGLVAVTGALHEDGLADVADGFGGGHERERRLEIMRDSHVGSYGVIALAGSIIVRIAALSAILNQIGPLLAGVAIMATAAASRGAVVWLWASLPGARDDGVAASAGAPPEGAVNLAATSGLAIFAVLGTIAAGVFNAAVALLLAAAVLQGFTRLCQRMIGGVTGDTLGACQQLVEIALLAGLALRLTSPT
jgi:adenosylcobinamide-GDP ribazoletransferase